MPREIGPLSKGSIFRKLDQFLSHPKQNFLDDLRNPANFKLDQLGESRGLLQGQGQLDHTAKEWFGGGDERAAWWPSNSHKQEIIRQGYVKATEVSLASDPPKPIVTYWVTGGEHFEAMVAESDQEVTVFLLTPLPPQPAKTRTLPYVDERLWLVSTDARLAEVQEAYPPDERPKAKPTDTEGVSTMQMRAPA